MTELYRKNTIFFTYFQQGDVLLHYVRDSQLRGESTIFCCVHRSTTSIDKGFTAASGRYMVGSPAQLGLMGEAEQDRLLLPKS